MEVFAQVAVIQQLQIRAQKKPLVYTLEASRFQVLIKRNTYEYILPSCVVVLRPLIDHLHIQS